MPYLTNEELEGLKEFYCNPTPLNYAKTFTGIKLRRSGQKEVDYNFIRFQIDAFKYMIDQEKKKQLQEAEYKKELEIKYSDYEKQLAEKAEGEAVKQVDEALTKYFSEWM